MTSNLLLAQFKLYTRRKKKESDYYKVLIFSSKEAMYEYSQVQESLAYGKKQGRYNFLTITHHWTGYRLRSGRWRRQRQIGVILFCPASVTSGIVSHEASHATLYALYPKNKSRQPILFTNRSDEKFAWTLGWLVAQFWTAFYKLPRKVRLKLR